MHRTPLQLRFIKAVPNRYAVYAIRHEPTARIYIGSTNALRDKLRWWFYALQKPSGKAQLPVKVLELLNTGMDADTLQWTYVILDQDKPDGYNPKAWIGQRPEWPLVRRLHETRPETLLNNVEHLTATGDTVQYEPRVTAMGIQPMTYLGRKLGLRFGWCEKLLPHSFKLDPRRITPWDNPEMSFACYLYRSCKAMSPPDKNPTEAAIEELYFWWLRHVPTSEREAIDVAVPHTIDEALAVPLPSRFMKLGVREPLEGPARRSERNRRSQLRRELAEQEKRHQNIVSHLHRLQNEPLDDIPEPPMPPLPPGVR